MFIKINGIYLNPEKIKAIKIKRMKDGHNDIKHIVAWYGDHFTDDGYHPIFEILYTLNASQDEQAMLDYVAEEIMLKTKYMKDEL